MNTRTRRPRATCRRVGHVLTVASFGTLAVACSSGLAQATDVRLLAAGDFGADPFTASVSVTPVIEFPVDIRAVGGQVIERAGGRTTAGTAVVDGTSPGVYAGSTDRALCDSGRLVASLQEDARKAEAWAAVFDIPIEALNGFGTDLAAVVLTTDTLVNDHGYSDGVSTAQESVLQAGTAVLVDARGVPRVRCASGDPLTASRQGDVLEFVGEQWDGFDPDQLAEIRPGSPVDELTVIDLETGGTIIVPVGSGPPADVETPATTSNPSTSDVVSTESIDDPETTVAATDGEPGDAGWVASISDGGTGSRLSTSPDGVTWTEVSTVDIFVEQLAHGPNGWVAMGGLSESLTIYNSADLVTWTEVGDIASVGHAGGLVFANGRFVAASVSRTARGSSLSVHVSDDGLNWITITDPVQVGDQFSAPLWTWATVDYVEGVGFVLGTVHERTRAAVQYSFELFVSPDGQSWAPAGADGSRALTEIADDWPLGPLAAGNDLLVQAAQAEAPIVVYDPAARVTSVPCDECPADGEPVGGTPFEGAPVVDIAFGGGSFLAVDNSGQTYLSTDGRLWAPAGNFGGALATLAYGDLSAVSAPSSTGAPQGSALGDLPELRSDSPSGSGCTPGASPLPDGWWFGRIDGSERGPVDIRRETSFGLTVTCFELTPDAEIPYSLTAADSTVRTVRLGAGAEVVCATPQFDHIEVPHENGSLCGNLIQVWVRVEGGVATKLVGMLLAG